MNTLQTASNPTRIIVFRLAAFLGVCLAFATAQEATTLKQVRVNMVFSNSLVSSVNRNDATAAIRIWSDAIGNRKGFRMDSRVELFDDISEIRRRIRESMPGIVSLDTIEYLKLADVPGLEPTFSSVSAKGGPRHYVILVRNDSGLSSFPMLRGKSVIFHAPSRANLGQIWSDSLLFDGHLGPSERFYGATETVTKPSAAILPVFFGKADSAIVEEEGFETMKEMNPQIGARLKVVLTSSAVIEGLLCISKGQNYRADLLDSLLKLHLEPQGKQILTVFRFGSLVPIDMAALDYVRQMWLKHKQLTRVSEPLKLAPAQTSNMGERP